MVGLAGVAYGLARAAEPDRLPCVLTLSPPPGMGGMRPSDWRQPSLTRRTKA